MSKLWAKGGGGTRGIALARVALAAALLAAVGGASWSC
jgi:hypothetical protein